jgi:ATP-dependent Clp endopeptidase proteolytic subunit ClpP
VYIVELLIYSGELFMFKFSKLQEPELPEELPPAEIIIEKNDDLRILGLYGELDELKAAHAIVTMIDLAESAVISLPKDLNDPESELVETTLPMEFLISTPGGSADDMFAIYDVMRVSREKCDIITYGLGKVMSAGVLILAAGTKGQRKIGKNCRVMIHSVIGGSAGSFHNLQNEMSEIKHIQSAYIKALSEETNMTVAYLKRMLNKKVNIYLSAEEAVELGIADIIV